MAFWAAAAPIIGGVAASALSALSGDNATKKQIAWERERAKNAHQWEVEDLKKAGLNPILSAGGSGAVTGGISAPVADTSSIAGAIDQITAFKAQKAQQELQKQQVLQSKEETKNLKAQNKLINAQAKSAQSNSSLTVLENRRRKEYLNSNVGYFLNNVGYATKDIGGAVVGGVVGGVTARGVQRAIKTKDTKKAFWYNPKTGRAELLE